MLLLWLIVWAIKGFPHIVFPDSTWAIALYVCAALTILTPRRYGGVR